MTIENETHTEVAESIAAPVVEALSDVIEAQEQSAQVAEVIAEAALEGARGHHIDELNREVAQCHLNISELRETLETLPGAIAEQTLSLLESLNQRLSAVEDARPVLESVIETRAETPAELSTSIPPTLETTPANPDMIAVPAESPAVVESPASPARRRFHSI